jgi:EAL domain-containing protein (putative c-di-GMP-specific phosphodiesterase class I)
VRRRRLFLDLLLALGLLAYASVLPELSDVVEHMTLTTISFVTTFACFWVSIAPLGAGPAPEARAAWRRFAFAGVALTAHHALFFIPVNGGVRETLRGQVITGLATIGLVVGGSALVLVVRPLLSYGPTRRFARFVAPLTLVGACTVPLADPYLDFGNGLASTISVTLSITVCCLILLGLALVGPALLELGRPAEISIGLAVVAMFGVTSFTVFAGYSAYWALPAVTAMVVLARGAVSGSSALVGCPIADRPIITKVRFRRAAGAAVPMMLVFPAVALGASRSVALAALAATLVLSSGFADELWSGRRAQTERPPERTVSIARSLQTALVHDELTLHYQPIVALSDRRVMGFESLLRWIGGPFGDVGPEELLAAARWQGLVAELELWVVGQAVRCLTTLRRKHDTLYLTVNLTPGSLQRPGFAEGVMRHLELTGGSLKGMTVEIVEYGHIDDWATLRDNVACLKAAGALIALDDFGAGTSNLQYLTEIEADFVKLDRSLVVWAGSGGDRVVKQIVEMARSAGLGVVAEGIEDEALLAAVIGLGVELGQGYLFSRPVDLEGATALARLAVPAPPVPPTCAPITDRDAPSAAERARR